MCLPNNVRLLGLGVEEGGVIERKTTVPSTIRFGKVKYSEQMFFFVIQYRSILLVSILRSAVFEDAKHPHLVKLLFS